MNPKVLETRRGLALHSAEAERQLSLSYKATCTCICLLFFSVSIYNQCSPSTRLPVNLFVSGGNKSAAKEGKEKPSNAADGVLECEDSLSLCFCLIALQLDSFHERYKRRGIGHKRIINVDDFLADEKVL